MEIAIDLLVIATILILVLYLKPIFFFLIGRKRVNLTYVDKNGVRSRLSLFLADDDPLFDLIREHKGSVNERR